MPAGLTLPHHDGSPLYVSTASPVLGQPVSVRVRVPREFAPVTAVRVRSNPDHEPVYAEAEIVHSDAAADWWQADVLVENPVHGYRFMFVQMDGTVGYLNAAGYAETELLDAEDFKLVTYPAAPEWASSSVMYQIFPDRFARSAAADDRVLPEWAEPAAWSDEPVHVGPSTPRQFYGGDLLGIEQHLDYLVSLGVNLIYLTPVFPAGSNHRYDAHSFSTVDPLLGGDEALVSLVRAAHARGLRVIGDLTSNHSGDTHEWFTASYRTPGAPESEFYYWLDAEQSRYVSWLGVPSLPKFNWASTELRRRFIEGPDSVVAQWLGEPYNLDGWRIDVANMTGRYLDDDFNAEVRRTIRRTMIEVNPDTILLAESTNDASSDFQGDAWHGAMTYANFTRPLWGWLSKRVPKSWFFGIPADGIPHYTGTQFFEAHQRFAAGFPWQVRLHTMNALDTHDTARFRTSAIEGAVPVALGMSVTLPGIPVIFAGDEFGLVGDDGEHSRSPLPWSALNSDTSLASETVDLYSTLIALRRDHPALNHGGIRWLHVGDDVLVYLRESAEESILVLAARAAFDVTVPVGSIEVLFGSVSSESVAGRVRLRGTAASFGVWAMDGVTLPAFSSPTAPA